MFPTLFHIFGESVPAYFVMLMTGFGLATWLGVRWAKRLGLDHEVIIDLGLYSLIAGVAGGRILHVLADGYFWDYVHLCTDPSQVIWHIDHARCEQVKGVWDASISACRPASRDCFAWAAFWSGGLAYYGGLIGATAFGLYFLRKQKFPMWKGADMAGLVIPVGLFFGRMGCFLGGCCFGQPTDGPLGVAFPAWSPASESQARAHLITHASLPSLPVYPTQLFEAFGCLGLAAVLMFVVHPKKQFDGQVFCAFLVLYGLLRFVIEFLRADDRGAVFGLSTSQLISAVGIAIVAVVYNRLAAAKTVLVEGTP